MHHNRRGGYRCLRAGHDFIGERGGTRTDHFKSPIVRGMARTKPKQRARKRTLTDQEIRDVWVALETADVPECYPRFLKSLLMKFGRFE